MIHGSRKKWSHFLTDFFNFGDSFSARKITQRGAFTHQQFIPSSNIRMSSMMEGFNFAIDRGGTFTDIYCTLPNKEPIVRKLLSVDPRNYKDVSPTSELQSSFLAA